MFCPRVDLSLQTQHSPLYPLLSLPFRIFIQPIYHNVVYHLISSASNFLAVYHFFYIEHSSAGSSSLVTDPANLFSSSLSVPALFFLLPLFPAQLHFSVHFTRSILLHIHISNVSSRFCSFRRIVQVSAPYNATLLAKHFTSLFRSSFSKYPQIMLLFLLKASFAIAILCFTS